VLGAVDDLAVAEGLLELDGRRLCGSLERRGAEGVADRARRTERAGNAHLVVGRHPRWPFWDRGGGDDRRRDYWADTESSLPNGVNAQKCNI
jgi:hypothetical protein